MIIRRGFSGYPDVLKLVTSHCLIKPELIGQLVEGPKAALD